MAKRIDKRDIVNGNILEDLNKYLDESKGKFGSLEISIKALQDAIKALKTDASRLKKEVGTIDVSSVKGMKELNEKRSESNKIMLESTKLQQQETKLLIEKERLTQAQLRTQKQLNSERQKTLTVYQQESKRLNELRNNYKNLAIQNKENTREGRNMLREITALDKKLKDIDNRVGQNQRSVGKYTDAWKGLRGVLGQVGLAFGGAALIGNAGRTVVEFDQAIQDLVSITGAGGKDLEFFKNQAIGLGKEVEGGASAVIEAYKLIGSAKPELLKNSKALDAVTQSAIKLSQASGMTLPDAATALTDAMNQFGAPAEKAGEFIDKLANGALFGSAEIPQVTEALLRFGAVSKTSNVPIGESVALIESLAEKGLKGADAGTALRNVMLKLSAPDALPKEAQERLQALGINFDQLRDKSRPFSERLELLKPLLKDNAALVKVFGNENAVAATNLISQTDRIKELTKQMDTNGTATKQAEERNKSLSFQLNKLKESWNAVVLEFANGQGVGAGVGKVVGFIADNLSTIIPLVFKSALAFGAYKTTLLAVNVVQSISDKGLKNIIKSFFDFKKAADGGGSSVSKFGNALKGVGWTAIIALAAEVATEIYEIASGARLAEVRLKALNDAIAKGQDVGQSKVGKYTESLKKQMQTIDLMNVSEKERIKLRKEAVKSVQGEIKSELNRFQALHKQTDQSRKLAIAERDRFKANFNMFTASIEEAALMARLENQVTKFTAVEKAQSEVIKALRGEMETLNDETHTLTVEQKTNTESTQKNTTAKQEQKKAYKDAGDEIERVLGLLQEEQDLIDGVNSSEFDSQFSSEIAAQQDNINQNQEVNLENLIRIKEAEEQYQKALAKRDYLNDIENAKSEQEVLNAQLKYQIKLTEIEEKGVERQKEINGLIGDQNQALEEKDKVTNKVAETVEKTYDKEREYMELTTKLLEDQIDKRIELLDKEIDARKKQQEVLQELANNGNINAQQSIAEEARLQREAEVEKQKLERRKQYLKLTEAFITSYTNKLEQGKDGTQALTEALAEKATLEAIIATIPAFYEGTEDTGRVNNPLDVNGGRLAVLHDNERVMTAEQNKQLQGLSNSDVVAMVQKGKLSETFSGGWENIGMMNELNGLRSDIKDLTDVVKNKPETEYRVEEVVTGVLNLIKSTKKGNTTIINKHQYRS